MTDVCRGCYTRMLRQKYPFNTNFCSLINDLNDCPCIECIVKPVCNNACEAFKKFTGEDTKND
jgi:hypothetical protein